VEQTDVWVLWNGTRTADSGLSEITMMVFSTFPFVSSAVTRARAASHGAMAPLMIHPSQQEPRDLDFMDRALEMV
jgi:hypothetical protein